MSERDIRSKLLDICGDLDRAAGRVGPVGRATAVLAPFVITAGLGMVACDDETESGGDGGSGNATTTSTTTSGSGGWGGSVSFYGVGGEPSNGGGGWGGSQSDYGVGGAGGT